MTWHQKNGNQKTVSALAFQSTVVLEQLTAAIFLSTKFDPWLSRKEWKKQIGVCKKLFFNMSGKYKELFYSFFPLG